jgi:hypothetical protein
MTEFFIQLRPIMAPLHGLIGAIGVGATIATDVLFMEFLRDCKISKMESNYAKLLSKIFWTALVLLIITGIALVLTDPNRYMNSSKFLTKMVAVIVIGINGLVLNYILTPKLTALNYCDNQDPKLTRLKQLSFLCGSISLFSWPLAFVLGSISSIPFSPLVGICLYLLCLCAVGLSSQTIYFIKSK